jgi:citrate lyase subunit beta-like protein
MLEKSRNLTVDCVAYDLEDSVTPAKKANARRNIFELLNRPRAPGIREQAVRINSMSSGLAEDDLRAVVTHHLSSFRLTKISLKRNTLMLLSFLR